jgi:hypothetical protein
VVLFWVQQEVMSPPSFFFPLSLSSFVRNERGERERIKIKRKENENENEKEKEKDSGGDITSCCAPLFSGTLYWLAPGGPRWPGPVTPPGGILLLAGWGFVIAGALEKSEK